VGNIDEAIAQVRNVEQGEEMPLNLSVLIPNRIGKWKKWEELGIVYKLVYYQITHLLPQV